MSFFVAPEFDFKVESVRVEDALPSPSHRTQMHPPRLGLKIELTHRATGRVAVATLRHFSVDRMDTLQRAAERLVLESFSDSDTAERLRRERHQIPVVIKPTQDLAVAIGNGFPVALRKFTHGPASGLWWNLIYRMPIPLYRLLREKTAFDLLVYERKARQLGRPMQLNACITVAKNAWESTLDLARLYFDRSREDAFIDDLRRTRAPVFEGVVWPDLADLTLHQVDALFQASQDGYMALDLLTSADWASLLWTVVEEPRAETVVETTLCPDPELTA